MAKLTRRTFVTASALTLGLAGCSNQPDAESSEPADPDAEVTISVGNLPANENAESREQFLGVIEQFTDKFPNISVDPVETSFDPATFNAMVGGGTMPTTMWCPFTEISGLIAREQVADLSDYLEYAPTLDSLHPNIATNGQAPDGRTFGIPVAAYSMGLVYNRALFEQAGLDPDQPPTNWEDVRTAAVAIQRASGQAGFIMPTVDNGGGWLFTALNLGFGGELEAPEGDGYVATINTDSARNALEFIRATRWEDDAAGAEFLYGIGDARTAFAGGQIGMSIDGGDGYNRTVVNNGMDPDHYGLAPLPQSPEGIGTLAGGSFAIVSPDATPNQRVAALRWTEFRSFRNYTDEEMARSSAEARAADGLPVGAPALPLVSDDLYQRYLGWIEEYVNVPRERFETYLTSELPLVSEPPIAAQEVYATLDPIIQAIYTDESADIDALLQQAQDAVAAVVARGV